MTSSLADLQARRSTGRCLSVCGLDGAVLFVSHDRRFLRGLANRVLDVSECASGGPARVYHGSYLEWVEKTGMEAPGVHA